MQLLNVLPRAGVHACVRVCVRVGAGVAAAAR